MGFNYFLKCFISAERIHQAQGAAAKAKKTLSKPKGGKAVSHTGYDFK